MGRKEGNPKHGMAYSPTYNSYNNMKQRCLNENNPSYKYYGGRGIKVCDRWLESFANFLTDMGEKPSPSLTIERLDNDKDYEPDNCVWADRFTQNGNKSTASKFGTGITEAYGGYMVRLKQKYVGYARTLEEAQALRSKAVEQMEEK